MSDPLIEIRGLVKSYQALRPLRVAELNVAKSDRVALRGLDAGAAEMLVLLITGAALPDEGVVVVGGRDTREIATDTEWLSSLDQFGIVTHRAVLLEPMSVAANLALPLTIAIDPIAPDMRALVNDEAALAGLAADALDQKVTQLSEEDRLRLHLARASAIKPKLMLLEHPTSRLNDAAASSRIGRTLASMSAARGFGWLAISEDAGFAETSGATRLSLDPATGTIAPEKRGWRRWL